MVDFKVLQPQNVSFKLEMDGQEVTLTLRPFNLADEEFLRETLTPEKQIKAAENLDIIPWLPIVWNQLVNDSKKIIGGIKVIEVDDNGQEFENKTLKGHEKLARVLTLQNVLTLWDALSKCRGISIPDIDNAKQEVKKNEENRQK